MIGNIQYSWKSERTRQQPLGLQVAKDWESKDRQDSLWLQEKVSDKKVWLNKVHTQSNIADLMTKPMSREGCERLMSFMNQRFVDGRALGAKHLLD